MSKAAVLLAAVPVTPEQKRYMEPGAFVVACDAGWRNAGVLGVTPDLLIGDFDSMPAAEIGSAKVPVLTLPAVKDDTDTHYAARWLAEHGYTHVTLLGALGGPRLEMTLANIATGLYLAQRGIHTRLADANRELCYLLPDWQLYLQQAGWRFFSVFPLAGPLTGVTITGAKYPLQNATLSPEYPLGVSNEFAQAQVTLRCTGGSGLVVLSR